MTRRRLIAAVLLVAAAASLARAVVTHDGVGPIEYAASGLLEVLLVALAVWTLRTPRA